MILENPQAFALPCHLKGESGKWSLEVENKPFNLKGVGCSRVKGESGINYLKIARSLGANTVRTWGIDKGNQTFLDAAEKLGLKVDAGIWLPHGNAHDSKVKKFSYIKDKAKLKKIEKEALAYVQKYKDHPALLMWNVGNEVIHFTKEKEERVAFSLYLEELIKKIKKIDPEHPVLYTFAGYKHIHYIKKYVPSLDIIGVNTYGSVDSIDQEMKSIQLDKPFIITESGPIGPWDAKKDQFGERIDQADYEKSFQYQYHLEEALRLKGRCLGVFPFRLGDPKRKLLSWWDLTVGKKRRDSFRVIYEHFQGKKMLNTPPICIGLSINKPNVKKGENIEISVKARDREKDPLRYGIKFWKIRKNNPKSHIPEIIKPEKIFQTSRFQIAAPTEEGMHKLIIYVYDGKGNIANRDLTFKVE